MECSAFPRQLYGFARRLAPKSVRLPTPMDPKSQILITKKLGLGFRVCGVGFGTLNRKPKPETLNLGFRAQGCCRELLGGL